MYRILKQNETVEYGDQSFCNVEKRWLHCLGTIGYFVHDACVLFNVKEFRREVKEQYWRTTSGKRGYFD